MTREEEEKQRLFDAIKERGYKWNAETKTLEKLVEPKFDTATLKPFDKVLARNTNSQCWKPQVFIYIRKYKEDYPYLCNNDSYKYCIPYNEETKHLVGTTKEAPEYYRYWED